MRIISTLAALATIFVTAAPTLAAQSITDQQITDAVEREFLYDHATPSNNIDVDTAVGVVTLEGDVPNVLAKDRALRIAETVKGVRSVVDLVTVQPPRERTDDEIRRDIERALLNDPAADSYEVSVLVRSGNATLSGTVDSWAEKRLSEQIAKGVKGVTQVTNNITISYTSERLDSEVKADIEQALRWNYLVDDGLIVVDVADGKVTLSGTVGSAAEKRQARYDAWTAGVKSVDDSGLTVARWARDDDLRKKKYLVRSDDEIRRAVEAALLYDPRVSSFNVNTSVSGGIVTLRGVVDNLKAKRAAEADVDNTVGVVSVRNYLKVRPVEERDDVEIARDIRDAFFRDPYVERYEISTSVYGGTAYISGTVDSYYEKSRADDIASRVDGVIDVVNNLVVNYDPLYAYDPWVDPWPVYHYSWYGYDPSYTYKSDEEIRGDIDDELFWSPFVDADEVTVSVEDGVATLTGTVDSAMEKGAARDNAYEAGATYVRNRLKVE